MSLRLDYGTSRPSGQASRQSNGTLVPVGGFSAVKHPSPDSGLYDQALAELVLLLALILLFYYRGTIFRRLTRSKRRRERHRRRSERRSGDAREEPSGRDRQLVNQRYEAKARRLREVLSAATTLLGRDFVDRIVWLTQTDRPEHQGQVPVRWLINLMALMNISAYPPAIRIANRVFRRNGLVVWEFTIADGEGERTYNQLTRLLPELINLYDYIYRTMPEVDPAFDWAQDFEASRPRHQTTPFLNRECRSTVAPALLWPIFSAFRVLLTETQDGALVFSRDPIELFESLKHEIVALTKSFYYNQAQEHVSVLGSDKEYWLRMQALIEAEVRVRERLDRQGPAGARRQSA